MGIVFSVWLYCLTMCQSNCHAYEAHIELKRLLHQNSKAAIDSSTLQKLSDLIFESELSESNVTGFALAIEEHKQQLLQNNYNLLRSILFRNIYYRPSKVSHLYKIAYGKRLIQDLSKQQSSLNNYFLQNAIQGIRVPYRNGGLINEGINFIVAQLQYFKNINDSESVSNCYYVLAGFYRVQGLIDRAIYFQKKSLSYLTSDQLVFDNIPFMRNLSSMRGIEAKINRKAVLAFMYVLQDSYQDANRELLEALQLYKSTQFDKRINDGTFVFHQLARLKTLRNEDSASYYFNVFDEYNIRNENYNLYRAHISQENAFYYYKHGQYQKAESCIAESKKIIDSLSIPIQTAPGYLLPGYYHALIKTATGLHLQAITLLRTEIEQLKAVNLRTEILKEQLLLADCYSKANLPLMAYAVMQDHALLQQDILLEQNQNRSLSSELERELNEREIDYNKVLVENRYIKQSRIYIIIFAVLIILIIIILLNRYQQKKEMAMAAMREKLRKELDQDIGSALGSISLYAEIVGKKIRAGHTPDAEAISNKIGAVSRDSVDQMNDIMWSLNTNQDHGQALLLKFQTYVAQIDFQKFNFVFESKQEFSNTNISMINRRYLYMFFKTIVSLASKYLTADNVIVKLSTSGQWIILDVKFGSNSFNFSTLSEIEKSALENLLVRLKDFGGQLQHSGQMDTNFSVSIRLQN
ncbi:MAG: hypothetical protein RIQ89_2192 [Bacteroidota bacterium]